MASTKRRKRPYPIDQKLEVIRARQKGLKVQDVAVMFNVGTTTVRAWEHAYAAQRPARAGERAQRQAQGLKREDAGRPGRENPDRFRHRRSARRNPSRSPEAGRRSHLMSQS